MRTHPSTLNHLLGLLTCAMMVQPLMGCTIETNGARIQVNGKTFAVNGMPGGNKAQEIVQQRVAAEQIDKLDLDTAAGNIEIRANEDSNKYGANTIQIRATKYITGNLPVAELNTDLPKVKVTQKRRDNTLVVQSEAPEGALPNGVSYYVSYVVTIPKRLALRLKTVSGDITASAARGGVKANSSSGSIELKAVAGSLDLQTVSGQIDIEDAPDASSVTVATSSGNMKLKNIAGRFDARSISGDISVQGATISDGFTVESSSGALKFTDIRAIGSNLALHLTTVSGDIAYDGDASKIDVHTSSGSIEIGSTTFLGLKEAKAESISGNVILKLPGLKAAQITAHTVSGSLHLPGANPDTENEGEDRRSATVKLGIGATPVTLSTSSGDITLTTEH